MQYKEVVKKIAEETNVDQKAIHLVLEMFQEIVRKEPTVSIYAFGKFWHKTIPAHTKRNPATGGQRTGKDRSPLQGGEVAVEQPPLERAGNLFALEAR